MAYHSSPIRAIAENWGSGEELLAVAVWAQVMKDAGSSRADLRQSALDFLTDDTALRFWGEMLGISVDVLTRYVQRSLPDVIHREGGRLYANET
jgi:hypothetical protein